MCLSLNCAIRIPSDCVIEESFLSILEKIIMAFLWIVIEVFGIGLLFGLIQFDPPAEDPLKRRIIDQ